jgi:hypothetical protein
MQPASPETSIRPASAHRFRRAAEQLNSRAAEQLNSRTTEQPDSRTAGQPDSRTAGQPKHAVLLLRTGRNHTQDWKRNTLRRIPATTKLAII